MNKRERFKVAGARGAPQPALDTPHRRRQSKATGVEHSGSMDGIQAARKPPSNKADLEVIFKQAVAGAPDAMRDTATLLALGVGATKDWSKAVDWLGRAAKAGSAAAAEELALLGPDPASALQTPALKIVSSFPYIGRVEAFATPALCDWLIRLSRPLLQDVEVYEMPKEGFDENGARSNTGAALRLLEFGLPLVAVRERMAALVGLPTDGFETTNVLHYNIGETFSPHYDTFLPEQMYTEPDARQFGHREFTVLIYLNTEYDGGHTDFPLARWSYRGNKGDALFWRNVTTSMDLDRNTLHAGRPPTSGEKWVLSQWIRRKRMPLTL